jgi:hypothetical protein
LHLPKSLSPAAQSLTICIDTSEESKKNSAEAIQALGGEVNQYSGEDKPRSKNAAEKLDGSRVAQ